MGGGVKGSKSYTRHVEVKGQICGTVYFCCVYVGMGD